MNMELAANVWPVVDSRSRLVQRYFMRAYAMEAADEVINQTLGALAPGDFRLAKTFAIPEQFKFVTGHGTLAGCVTLADFHKFQFQVLEAGFKNLERDHAKLQGIAIDKPEAEPIGVGVVPRFPQDPYLMVTVISEMPDGSLHPQLDAV